MHRVNVSVDEKGCFASQGATEIHSGREALHVAAAFPSQRHGACRGWVGSGGNTSRLLGTEL